MLTVIVLIGLLRRSAIVYIFLYADLMQPNVLCFRLSNGNCCFVYFLQADTAAQIRKVAAWNARLPKLFAQQMFKYRVGAGSYLQIIEA